MRADRLGQLPGARAAAFAGLLPGVDDLFESPPAERASPELRRTFEAITRMLCGLAVQRPVLVDLDDLQNAGRATVELLHYLARQAHRARLLVASTIRAEEGAAVIEALADVADRVELGPLPEDAVAQLAAEAGHSELTVTIIRRTRGHALFVAETLRGLAAGDDWFRRARPRRVTCAGCHHGWHESTCAGGRR